MNIKYDTLGLRQVGAVPFKCITGGALALGIGSAVGALGGGIAGSCVDIPGAAAGQHHCPGGDALALRREVDVVHVVHSHQPALAHLAQHDGYRRTGIGQIRAHVHRVHLVLAQGEDINRLQIVFDGL